MGKRNIKRLIVAAAALLLSGCSIFPGTTGSGNLVTKQMSLGNFDKIDASGTFHLDVTQGATYSVQITADDNIWNSLDIRNDAGTLRLALKSGSYNNVHVSAKITVPTLTALTMSGATEGSLHDFNNTDGQMHLNISGASTLQGNLQQKSVTLDISGASKVTLRGQADSTNISVSGASHGSLDSFHSDQLQANISGASGAEVNATKKLDYDVSGASHLAYSGNPTIGQSQVSGASSVQ